jgi:hypothetical protein
MHAHYSVCFRCTWPIFTLCWQEFGPLSIVFAFDSYGLSRNECMQASKHAAIQGSMPIYLGALCTPPRRREKCAPSCMKKSLFFHPPPGSAIRQTHPARARSLCVLPRRIQIKINTSLLDMQNRCFGVIGLAATNLAQGSY